MANVKAFADRQTDRWTNGQARNYMPPIYQYVGINKQSYDVSKKERNVTLTIAPDNRQKRFCRRRQEGENIIIKKHYCGQIRHTESRREMIQNIKALVTTYKKQKYSQNNYILMAIQSYAI